MRRAGIVLAGLGLAACGQDAGVGYDEAPQIEAVTFAGRAPAAAFNARASADAMSAGPAIMPDAVPVSVAPDTPEGAPEGAPQGGQMLAYSYDATLTLPPGAVADVMAAHRDACREAGQQACQVLSADLYAEDADDVGASLRFRAAPAYLAAFRAGLAGDADAAGGRLTAESQEVQDLTRQVLDLRARLDAQRTLRDRLADLLDRPGGVGELLQVERELARVQGEIEAMTSQLRYLEGRVSMNEMSVACRSAPQAFTPAKRQPLLDAVRDFFGILAESLAALIRVVAAALPWLMIGVPVLWLVLRRLRRRGRA